MAPEQQKGYVSTNCNIISHLRDQAVNHYKLFDMWSQLLTIKQILLGGKRILGPTLFLLVALHTHCACRV